MKFTFTGLALFAIASTLLVSGCGSKNENDTADYADSVLYIPRTELATSQRLKTATGMEWVVHQTPMLDSSIVNVRVVANGFPGDSLLFDFGEIDPVTELRTEDLDRDGFQELYIVTQSVGPERYGTIYGLYPDQDQSVTIISYEGATPYTMKEAEPYAGYRGQDQFRFEKGLLTNVVPVYRTEDNDAQPTGGTRTITYELVKDPVAVQLRPVREK